MDIGNIGIWIILGVLVACCVVPMLMMGRRGKHGKHGGHGGQGGDEGRNPPPQGGSGDHR